MFLRAIALTIIGFIAFQWSTAYATCPPNCGLEFTVNTTFDAATGADDATPGNGICETVPGNGVCTLRAAIEEANAFSSAHGGVTNGIGFNIPTSDPNYNGIFWTINLASALPNLGTNMDIIGPDAGKLTVKRNAAAGFRIFNVTATGTVALSGMTISNGNLSGQDGAGIANGTGTINVSACVISGNTAKHGAGVMNSGPASTVNLTNCTLTGNTATGGGGGGIHSGGIANLANCTVSGNFALLNGGGIDNSGTLNLTNSTISGNSATSSSNGGGICNEAGTINVTNCTISSNTAGKFGGGIQGDTSTTNIKSSIIALNTAGTSGPDVNGSFTGQGFNLIGKNDGAVAAFPAGNPNANNDIVGTTAAPIDPKLDPNGLQDHGGATLTIALLPASPALDKGTSVGSTGTLTTDQRGSGYPRTFNDPAIANAAGGDGTDVGAFEVQGPVATTGIVSRKTHGGSPFDVDLAVNNNTGVECRSGGATNDYQLIVTFSSGVTVNGNPQAQLTSGTGQIGSGGASNGGGVTVNGAAVTIPLTNISNAQTINVTLFNVSNGSNTTNVVVPMRVLLGDTNGDGSVNSGDIGQTKSKSGQTVDVTNFRNDVNVDGTLNSGDIGLVKSKSGTALP